MGHRIPVYVVIPKKLGGLYTTREKIFVHPDYEIDVIHRLVKNKHPDFKTFRWKQLTIINHGV